MPTLVPQSGLGMLGISHLRAFRNQQIPDFFM
jgi:hypothetical protein